MYLGVPEPSSLICSVPSLPPGWRAAAERHELDLSLLRAPGEISRPLLQSRFEAVWQEITGRPSRECHCTLLVPIHNEERVLPSLQAALSYLIAPRELNLQIVFITNGCTDRSPTLVGEFLSSFGRPQEVAPGRFLDAGLRSAQEVSLGALRLLHLDTVTRGKGNALTLGTATAAGAGHPFVLSIDADCWPEPDALPRLFRDAEAQILGGTAAVVSGVVRRMIRPTEVPSPFLELLRARAAQPDLPRSDRVNGCLAAWDVAFFTEHGIPRCRVEDFAMGLVARIHGRTVAMSEAASWVFAPATLTDMVRTDARFAAGHMQLREMYRDNPRAQALLGELTSLQGLGERLRHRLEAIRASPRETVPHLLKAVLREAIQLKARYDLWRDPGGTTWVPCGSTKCEMAAPAGPGTISD